MVAWVGFGKGVLVIVGRTGASVDVGRGRGVVVDVGVKVGGRIGVLVGIEVDICAPGDCPKFVKRQACKKAMSPAKPAPFKKCRLFIKYCTLNFENPFTRWNLTSGWRQGKFIIFVLRGVIAGVDWTTMILEGARVAVVTGTGHHLAAGQRLNRFAQIA